MKMMEMIMKYTRPNQPEPAHLQASNVQMAQQQPIHNMYPYSGFNFIQHEPQVPTTHDGTALTWLDTPASHQHSQHWYGHN